VSAWVSGFQLVVQEPGMSLGLKHAATEQPCPWSLAEQGRQCCNEQIDVKCTAWASCCCADVNSSCSLLLQLPSSTTAILLLLGCFCGMLQQCSSPVWLLPMLHRCCCLYVAAGPSRPCVTTSSLAAGRCTCCSTTRAYRRHWATGGKRRQEASRCDSCSWQWFKHCTRNTQPQNSQYYITV
jgi:hypothetical protein